MSGQDAAVLAAVLAWSIVCTVLVLTEYDIPPTRWLVNVWRRIVAAFRWLGERIVRWAR